MWLEIGKIILEAFSNERKIQSEKRAKLAAIFQQISELLHQTAIELANDQYPHGKCAAMELLSREFVDEISGHNFFQEDKLKEIDFELQKASKLELEYSNRKNPETIVGISITSGKFHALSLLLKSQ